MGQKSCLLTSYECPENGQWVKWHILQICGAGYFLIDRLILKNVKLMVNNFLDRDSRRRP